MNGEIDGVAARFIVDTGSRKSLTASSPFVEEHALMKRYAPAFEAVTGWGVGGEVRGWPVRFREIKVGRARALPRHLRLLGPHDVPRAAGRGPAARRP